MKSAMYQLRPCIQYLKLAVHFPAKTHFNTSSFSLKESFDWPQIAIQPVEGFLGDLWARWDVARFENDMAFVLLRRAQQPEHVPLRRLEGEKEIVSAIEHQSRNRNVGCEVDLVHLM